MGFIRGSSGSIAYIIMISSIGIIILILSFWRLVMIWVGRCLAIGSESSDVVSDDGDTLAINEGESGISSQHLLLLLAWLDKFLVLG